LAIFLESLKLEPNVSDNLMLIFTTRHHAYKMTHPRGNDSGLTTYNTNIAYAGPNHEVLLQWSHPYFQGWEFGEFLKYKALLHDRQSEWYGADKLPGWEPFSLNPPHTSTSLFWFSRIRDGLKEYSPRDKNVMEYLQRLSLTPPPQGWNEARPAWFDRACVVLPWEKKRK
jgi:hypothetical protein